MPQRVDVGKVFLPPFQENESGLAQQSPFTGLDLETEFPLTTKPFFDAPNAVDRDGTVQYAVHHDHLPTKREAFPGENYEQQIDMLAGQLAQCEQFKGFEVQWRNELLLGVTDRLRTVVSRELQTTFRDLANQFYELYRQKYNIIEESSSGKSVVMLVNKHVCEALAQRLRNDADGQILQARARRTGLRAYDPAFATQDERARQHKQNELLQRHAPIWRVAPVDGGTDQEDLAGRLQTLARRLKTEIATLRASRSPGGAAAIPTSEDDASARNE